MKRYQASIRQLLITSLALFAIACSSGAAPPNR
ncbi:hypothetical protein NAL19_3244 [Pectobacterium sp. F1-1]|nr:hypothetical protein NAL19_3244 [Pectobacterium sp. F1-1]